MNPKMKETQWIRSLAKMGLRGKSVDEKNGSQTKIGPWQKNAQTYQTSSNPRPVEIQIHGSMAKVSQLGKSVDKKIGSPVKMSLLGKMSIDRPNQQRPTTS